MQARVRVRQSVSPRFWQHSIKLQDGTTERRTYEGMSNWSHTYVHTHSKYTFCTDIAILHLTKKANFLIAKEQTSRDGLKNFRDSSARSRVGQIRSPTCERDSSFCPKIDVHPGRRKTKADFFLSRQIAHWEDARHERSVKAK